MSQTPLTTHHFDILSMKGFDFQMVYTNTDTKYKIRMPDGVTETLSTNVNLPIFFYFDREYYVAFSSTMLTPERIIECPKSVGFEIIHE